MRVWLVGALAAATGCVVVGPLPGTTETGVDSVDGQVRVTWRIGTSTCEAAGITEVEIQIGTRSERFACPDLAGTVTVPAGVYGLDAVGYDAEGLPRYGASADDVAVYEGQATTIPTLVLSSLPANVSATWYFDNGRLCGVNGVETVDLSLFDLADNLKAELQAPCDDGAAFVGQVEAGDYVLVLYGLDLEGTATWRGQVPASVTRGESVVLDVELAPELGDTTP